MSADIQCIFCKIRENEIKSCVVYRDEHTLAFLDAHPANPGHTLVVPLEHIGTISQLLEADWLSVARTVKLVSAAIQQAMNTDHIMIKMNNGKHAGQDVPHAHVHVVPRYENDGVIAPMVQHTYQQGEAEDVAERIKKAID